MVKRHFLAWALFGMCLGMRVGGASLVFDRDAEWRWFKGIREASSPDASAWRAPGFDDSGWGVGSAPFFYGEPLTGTELVDMRGGYTCMYLRRHFEVVEPAGLGAVRLKALSDDGFAAWINGKPVARFNLPDGEVPFNGNALGTFNEPLPTETYEIANFAEVLVPGRNVIAVQACNASLSNSSDFVFEAALETEIDDVPPVAVRIEPAPGSRTRELTQITVVFSEVVEGVEAGDLRINGSPASRVTGFGGDQYVFEFPNPVSGSISVAWAAGAGIRDRSVRGNPFAGGTWTYVVDPNLPIPGVTISEFMAANDDTLNDEDGDASDWIEIENGSDQVVNLVGWSLSNDPAQPMKWTFPIVSLAARGRLVVFASGKDRVKPTAPLHANFKLAREGGYLGLARPGGGVVSEFAPAYPVQAEDVSYGRLPTDPLKTGYFPRPTPGAPNGEGGPGFAPEVVFSRIGGTFVEPFSLSLRSEPGASVRYTLDGTVPTEASPEAVAPIQISTSIRVRARAFVAGLLPGRLVGESYVQLNPTAAAFTSTLPLVLIHSFGGGAVPANGEYSAFVSMYEPRAGVSSLTNAPDLRTRARVNIRGSSTLFQPKRNYSLEFRDEREADRALSPLGLPAESDWILYAPNNFEPILIHNPFAYRLSNQIGRYAPRTRFVEVYVQTAAGGVTSSHYSGIYVLMEKIKQGGDRVDVAKLEPEHVSAPQVTGGYVLKIDRLDPGDSGFHAGGQAMGFVEPKEEEMDLPQRGPQRAYLQNYLDRFGQALDSPNWRDPVVGWPAYIDAGSWIDHHILNVLTFNVDALRLSAYFYKPREGKLSFGPVWDFDRALNSTDGRDANPKVWRSQSSDRGTDFFNYPWWGRLFQDPDFWQRWIDRYQELRRGPLSTNAMYGLVDELTGQVSPAQPREAVRWAGFTSPRGSYQGEISQLKGWLGRRTEFMDTNFLAAPRFTIVPGRSPGRQEVVMSGPSGATLYFTLDGSDPRAPGGGIAAGATRYTQPVALPENGVIRARSHNPSHRNLTGADNPPISSPWSGPTEARASLLPGAVPRSLSFVEVHAHPAGPTVEEKTADPLRTASDYEFLEILNAGTASVDLGDLRLSGGVGFGFSTGSVSVLEPGGRILLVRNRVAFTQRYGDRGRIAGEYQGSLDSGGETLRIRDGAGQLVAEANYRTSREPAADGLGFSLVWRDAGDAGAHGVTAGWAPSARVGGSPGVEDPPAAPSPRVVINEVLTHTDPPQLDGVELLNASPSSADISGWYLTDDRGVPMKYQIPAGTILAPGGLLWIDEAQFNAGPNPATRFQLKSTGDDVWLFAADTGGRLTGYAHGFDFGASPNGVSFGRSLDCDRRETWLAEAEVSPGLRNLGPKPVSILISEVHYRPLDIRVGGDQWDDSTTEFVELANVTDTAVPLFDPSHPTNTWLLRDAVTYRFPQNVSVPPRGVVVVVNFDPGSNPLALARFRAVHRVPAEVALFGPYAGSLPNGAGKVELERPDLPQQPPSPDAGDVPYILVDRVNYSDSAPWSPLADGGGKSLNRVAWERPDVGARGWVALSPSPGMLPPQGLDSDADGIPDAWEAQHCLDPNRYEDGLLDEDGDGASNREEYVARTDPGDHSDVLAWATVAFDRAGARLGFRAKAGVGYVVEVSDTLSAGGWRRLREIPPQTVDRVVQVEEVSAAETRFFRLVVGGAQ